MQSIKEEFKEYSDILDADFSDWDDDFFSENVQFSDVENKYESQQVIKNLQYTNNRTGIQSGNSRLCQDVSFNSNVATKWKEIGLSKLCTLHTSRDLILQNQQNNNTSCIRKHPDEHSGSEDFCVSTKKRRKTEIHDFSSENNFLKRDETFTPTSVPINSVNDKISLTEIPLEETPTSYNQEGMTISQETVDSQKEVKSIHSQTSLSPTTICSSQESLGNKIMKISLDECDIFNVTIQSGTHTLTTSEINSECQQNSTQQDSKSETMNQNVNFQKLKVYNQKCLSNDTFSSKRMKEKDIITVNFTSSVSDTSCVKSTRRYNKEQKRITWHIRKRELEVTRKENTIEIREKLLDAREADIQKREKILMEKERKYLRFRAKIKNKLQKHAINSKKLKRVGVLEDDTNSFNKRCAFKVFK